MRMRFMASLMLIGVMVLAVRGKPPVPPHSCNRVVRTKAVVWHAGQNGQPAKNGQPAPAPAEPKNPAWIVEGKKVDSRADAVEDARLQAQVKVIGYLRSQQPPVEWVPSLDYVQTRLVKKPWEERTEKFDDGLGELHDQYFVKMEVEITPQDRADMLRLARAQLVQQRMFTLGKLLAALVVVLGAVAGYLRLDDRTKGYYTGWLRVGAVAAIAAAGIGLYLIA